MILPFLKVLYYFVENYEGSKMFPYLQTGKSACHSCLDTQLLGQWKDFLTHRAMNIIFGTSFLSPWPSYKLIKLHINNIIWSSEPTRTHES